MKGFPDLPPVWLLGFMAMAWLLAAYLPLVTAFGPVVQTVGWLMILVGIALILWAGLWFARKRTSIEPHHQPTALIVEGPYRLSRNPIYLALVVILTGYVFSTGALSPIILPFVFFGILTRRFVEPEEAALGRAFGAEAQAYLEVTRRWV